MKRVLIVAYYFPPLGLAGVNRPLHLFKYLPACGWEPHILTVKPVAYAAYEPELLRGLDQSRIHRSDDYWLRRRLAFLAQIAPLGAFRERLRASRFGQRIFSTLNTGEEQEPFPDALYRWAPFAIETGRRLLGEVKFDLILSTSPPITTHLVGQTLHRESGIPWVADFRDYWSANQITMPYSSPILQQRALELLESFRTEASALTTVNATYQQLLGASEVIHNSYDDVRAGEWIPPPKIEMELRVGVLGNMSNRTWKPLIELVKGFNSASPVPSVKLVVHHVGDDHGKRGHLAFKSAGIEDQLICHGRHSRGQSVVILNQAHLLFIGLDPFADDHLTPARIFDYLAAGRTVLAASSPTSELATLVRGLSYVHWYDVTKPQHGVDELTRILSEQHKAVDQTEPFKSRRIESKQFSASVMAGKFVTLFNSVLKKARTT